MTFNDIFKSSFLENMTSISILDMAVALTLAFGIGVFIFMVYKKTYQGVMYNLAFGGFQSTGSATGLVNYPIDDPVSGGNKEDRPMIAWILLRI